MTLAQRDLYLVRIENEMENKKKFLLEKYNLLGEMEEENEYLKCEEFLKITREAFLTY